MIIDASVAFKLLVEEPGSAEAAAWVSHGELIAPTLLHAEVGSALWKRVRRGELDADGIAERLADLSRIVSTHDETTIVPRALGLAIELAHPIYDCIYLALAEALDDELLTADKKVVAAVRNTPLAGRVRALGPVPSGPPQAGA